MEKQFEIIRRTRQFLVKLIEGLTPEQMNTIPSGFNNNIAWNFGHMVAAQQGVCYKRSGLPILVSEDFFERFKPESKPQDKIGQDELEKIRELLVSTIDELQRDYDQDKFNNYTSWTSRQGVNINTIEDAISFLNFHDGLHIGYIMALRHCV